MDLFKIPESVARERVSDELWELEKFAKVLATRLSLVRRHGIENRKEPLNFDRLYRDIQPCIDISVDILSALKEAEHELENALIE